MRSSKKRSRSSQNRPRTLGNIINRVFDSSGPEGKVRGTPQQIIEKYQMLARDAQLSNDRVAAENFLQHAEHYTRMLAEATREMAAEQEARQQQYQQNGGQNGGQSAGQQGGQPGAQQNRGDRIDRGDRGDRRGEFSRDFREDRDYGTMEQPSAPDVIDLGQGEDTGLIETPESIIVAPSRPRREPVVTDALAEAPLAREERGPRRPRGPRKPKAEGKPEGDPPKAAAE
ncbi:MAG: DUF4167 domain-containing protein [Rhodobacter sp.]|nr:DUF4167 domain-containing protein [Rhodobacter sp.]